MKEEMMNWTREDQVKWVSIHLIRWDREYGEYEKKKCGGSFLGMACDDDPLPEELQKLSDQIHAFPKDIYLAGKAYTKYLANVTRFAEHHNLHSLRVMLAEEPKYYDLPGEKLEEFTDKLVDKADREAYLHGEW